MRNHAWAIVAAAVAAAAVAAWLLMSGGPGRTPPLQPDDVEGPSGLGDAPGSRGASAGAAPPAEGSRAPVVMSRRFATGQSTVTGRVVDAATRGGVGSARVELRHALGEFEVSGESAEDGAFTLESVPGAVGARLFVTSPGYGPRLVRDVHVPPHDRVDLGVIEMQRGVPLSGRVVTPLGSPIAGARVDVLESTRGSRADFFDLIELFREVQRDDDYLESSVTAADGTFSFAALAPGSYALAAGKPGWQTRFSPPVLVLAGSATAPVDIRLTEARTLRGLVKDDAGRPVAAAEIAAIEVDPVALLFPRSQKTTTGPDGRFSYASFGAGDIGLVVRAAGHAPTTMGNLRAGGKEIEIVLDRAVRITGRVFDVVTGAGLAGASVVAITLDKEVGIEETLSGGDGTYVIEDGPAGSGATVVAKLGGYVMARHAEAMADGESARDDPEDDFVAGTTVRRDLPMVAGAVVSGRVVDAETGDGIPGAEVVARHLGQGFIAFSEPVRARAGPAGAFALPPIGAGKVALTATAAGYAEPSIADAAPEAAAGGPEARVTDVEVRAGAAVSGVILRIRRGHELDVLVADQDGKPVSGATVSWAGPNDPAFDLFGLRKRPRTVTTDAAGTVRLTGLREEVGIIVAARHSDGRSSGHTLADAPAHPGTVVKIVLVPDASVAGVLLDASGHPAPDYKVSVFSTNEVARAFSDLNAQAWQTETDRSGRFLIENLRPGGGSVHVAPPAGSAAEHGAASGLVDPAVLQLEAGKRLDVTLRLVRTEQIGGVVYDAAGQPVENVNIRATPVGAPAQEGEEHWCQSAPDGRFVLSGLRAGTWRLEAFRQVEGRTQTQTKSASTGSDNVEIRFPK